MPSNPRGAFVGTMLAAGIGKFQRSCAGGAGTLSGQFSLRVLGQAFPTSPFLFFGSAKPFLLFRREREEMVSAVSSPPQRRNSPAHNVRSRHRQVPEISRRRRRHIERTVQFASFGAGIFNKPLSLLGKSETAFSLSKGKRKGGVRPSFAAAAAKLSCAQCP